MNLPEVNIVPGNKYSLFSISQRLKQGWKLGGDDETLWITKEDITLKFDFPNLTPKGVLHCMYLQRSGVEVNDFGANQLKKMGHVNEAPTCKIAMHLNWEITRGMLDPCKSCAIGKARKNNVTKVSKLVAVKAPGERFFLDLSSVKGTKDGQKVAWKKNWRLMVDEQTGVAFSEFYEGND